jgi:uncharacterized protein (UPF0333 family)
MKDNLMDDGGQISAEMILLMGAMLIIVIIAGNFILGITKSVAGNITAVVNTARDSAINRM